MKRFWIACCIMVTGVHMMGCGAQIPDMTEEERTAISEYAVELLLKYDTNGGSRLVNVDEIEMEEPTPSPRPTKKPAEKGGMDETEDTPVIELEGSLNGPVGDLKTALGLEDMISIEYMGYQLHDAYKDDAGDVVIEAAPGKKLMVCNFALINDGAQKQSVDMLRENIVYTIQIDEECVNCMVTMLGSDLTAYMGILEPDESSKVVVVAECEEMKVNQANVLNFQVKRAESVASILLK